MPLRRTREAGRERKKSFVYRIRGPLRVTARENNLKTLGNLVAVVPIGLATCEGATVEWQDHQAATFADSPCVEGHREREQQ